MLVLTVRRCFMRYVLQDVEITMIVRVVWETRVADFVTPHVRVWTVLMRVDPIWVRAPVDGYHESGSAIPPVERMPGDGSQSMEEMLCSDTIYRRSKMREAIDKVDRANSWRVNCAHVGGGR